jgi:hypothetical protein
MGCAGDVARVSPSGTGEALLGAGWSAPNAYQFEGEIDLTKVMGAGLDLSFGIGFTYFFKAIDDTEKPYGLQEFYQSQGFVKLIWADLGEELSGDMADNWGLKAAYTLPAMDGKMAVHAAVAGDSGLALMDDFAVIGWDSDIAFSIGVDYQVMEDLNVSLDYASQGDVSDILLGAQYVLGIGEQDLSLGLGIDLADITVADGMVIGFDADYYLLKELAVGVALELWTGDFDATNYGLKACYNTGPVSLDVSYMVNDSAPNWLTAAVGYRF